MINRDRLASGMVVRSADGDKLGKIVSFDDNGVVVEKGIFFPKDYICSFDQIDAVSDDEVYLKWGTNLVEQQYDNYYGSGSYARETADEGAWTDYDYEGRRAGGGGRAEAAREHMSIPLREEELQVQKKGLREKGRVRIYKTVTTEDKTFTVPLRREEVHVERVPASELKSGESFGDVTGNFENKTVSIPVMEEEVEVTKRPVVKEAIKVETETKTVNQQIHGEVRKEEARIERDTETKETGKKKKAI